MDNYNGFSTAVPPSLYQQGTYYQVPPTYNGSQRNWAQYQPQTQPYSYQQQPQQAVPQQPQPQVNNAVTNTNLLWVQGEAAAKAAYVPNGCNMVFFDSESQTIYIKAVDITGKPSLTILDYTERNAAPTLSQQSAPEEPKVEYATKEQIDVLASQFSSINEKLNVMGKYVTKDQFDSLNGQLNDLSGQIEDIENRITSFGKPQQSSSNNRRGNK